jgi:starch synthase (maltosyl-transferring)
LQRLRNLWIHQTDNDALMCYSKREGADTVIVVVNLDPHALREGTVDLAMPALGLDWTDTFTVVDELSGRAFEWGQFNYVRLDPFTEPAHVLTVAR